MWALGWALQAGFSPLISLIGASDPIYTNPFASLGVASIAVASWFYVARTLWTDNQKLRAQNSELQQSRIDREVEFAKQREALANEVIPMLSDMATLLTGVPKQIETTLEKARAVAQSEEAERIVQRMESAAQKLLDGRSDR